ncbi:phage portal protein, partial [Shimia thalassica]
ADKVFHLRGFGPGDGIGMSAIAYGANSIGAALAADETAGSVFSNSMMPSGVLESDQTLTEPQREQLQAHLTTYVGSKKAGKTMLLEAGLKYNQLQMNPEDAQLLETRRYSVEDVCRWFGVPPIIIGHASQGQTMWGSGVEAIMLSWLTLGINPLLSRIESRIEKDLIPIGKRGKWVFRFNREGMLQMDSKAKGEFLSKMATSGTMTANERREKLNLPPH